MFYQLTFYILILIYYKQVIQLKIIVFQNRLFIYTKLTSKYEYLRRKHYEYLRKQIQLHCDMAYNDYDNYNHLIK
jgi:hypothetical protein